MSGRLPPVMQAMCKSIGLPLPEPEYVFAPPRKWAFDYCWPAPYLLALEIEGGAWSHGRHTRGRGFIGDMEKYNRAAILGYRIIRCTPKQFESGEPLEWIAEAIMEMR